MKARAGRNAGWGTCSTAPASPQDQDGETSHVWVTTQAPGTVGDTLVSISYNSMNDRACHEPSRSGRGQGVHDGSGEEPEGRAQGGDEGRRGLPRGGIQGGENMA